MSEHGAVSHVGQPYARGDVCPICLEEGETGRLRELECPDCAGTWLVRDEFGRISYCPRCDHGSVFLCDRCEGELP